MKLIWALGLGAGSQEEPILLVKGIRKARYRDATAAAGLLSTALGQPGGVPAACEGHQKGQVQRCNSCCRVAGYSPGQVMAALPPSSSGHFRAAGSSPVPGGLTNQNGASLDWAGALLQIRNPKLEAEG